MNILLTNDDGIQAKGLVELKGYLEKIGKVTVIAPDRERSGSGCSTTIYETVCCGKTWSGSSFFGYSLSGTPVDCVIIGLDKLLSHDKPQLVVAGINAGANLGRDVFYSGTVGAAMEGAFHDIFSMAISIDKKDNISFVGAIKVMDMIIKTLPSHISQIPMVLNINIPGTDYDNIRGFKLTQPAPVFHQKTIESIYRTEQVEYFWIAGSAPVGEMDKNSDYWAIKNNYVSITPFAVQLRAAINQDELEKWIHRLNY